MLEYAAFPSSAIDLATYDDNQLLMTIRFESGHVYEYAMVPPSIFEEYKQAASKGRYFQAEIRDFFPFARIS
jgi:lysyl-tRNA synthetase class 2